MNEKLKRKISILVIFTLLFVRTTPYAIYATETLDTEAQTVDAIEVSAEETAGETDAVIENEAEVVDEVTTEAESGENEIVSESPTPSPSPSPSPSPVVDEVSPSPTAEASPSSSPSPSPSPTSSSQVETGDSVSFVETENQVNSTEVNSEVVFKTLNIFFAEGVNLAIDSWPLIEEVVSSGGDEETVNVVFLENNNYAYLSNEIVSVANTGGNSATGETATIETGNAYSVVSLLNRVNTTIVDSKVYVVTINIFGELDGDIVLPDILDEETCTDCGGSLVDIENNAEVENVVTSSADSGGNAAEGENADIDTGDAVSSVNLVNVVNLNILNSFFRLFYINNLGEWSGELLGWGEGESAVGGCTGCVEGSDIANEAYVYNNVISTANTGGNSASGEEGSSIKTGNAVSAVSIVNFINTTIKNSLGFLGFVNIFGTFSGNIGTESMLYPVSDAADDEGGNISSESMAMSTSSSKEEGGELEVYQKNNVNDFVYPGDTVTFFVDVKNVGTGKVYGATLVLSLIKDGEDLGGGIIPLGDIAPNKGFKISTGLVLSRNALEGEYMAHAEVFGIVGPHDGEISAYSDSFFKIKVKGTTASDLTPDEGEEALPVANASGGQVLGAASTVKKDYMIYYVLLLMLTSAYLSNWYKMRAKEGVL